MIVAKCAHLDLRIIQECVMPKFSASVLSSSSSSSSSSSVESPKRTPSPGNEFFKPGSKAKALEPLYDPQLLQAEFADLLLVQMSSQASFNRAVYDRQSITVNNGNSNLEVIDKFFNADGSQKVKESKAWEVEIQQRVNAIKDYKFCKDLSTREIILLDAVIGNAQNILLEKYRELNTLNADASTDMTQQHLVMAKATHLMNKKKIEAESSGSKAALNEFKNATKQQLMAKEAYVKAEEKANAIQTEINKLNAVPNSLFNRLPVGPFLAKKNQYQLDSSFRKILENIASYKIFVKLQDEFVSSLAEKWQTYFTCDEAPDAIYDDNNKKQIALFRLSYLFEQCASQIFEGRLSCKQAFENYIMDGQGGLKELEQISIENQAKSPLKSRVASATANFYNVLLQRPYQFKPVPLDQQATVSPRK